MPENVPVAQTTSGILKIRGTDDVVAVEHRAREMAGDGHGHSLGDATTDQVPRCRPPEVMAQLPRYLSIRARSQPRLAEVVALLTDNRSPGSCSANLRAAEVREDVRDDPPELALQRFHAVHLGVQECFNFRCQIEVRAVLERLEGVPRLMAMLLYGASLRLLECCRLRVKDVDFATNQLVIRDGKGRKDRVTMLPATIKAALAAHIERVREQHQADLRHEAGWEWGWH